MVKVHKLILKIKIVGVLIQPRGMLRGSNPIMSALKLIGILRLVT